MLDASGIGGILREAGYVASGSQAMRTMTWRDLDFDREQDLPDWADHWRLGARLGATGWCIRMTCTDEYRASGGSEHGYYWGLRVADPAVRVEGLDDPQVWKLDLWTAREAEYAPGIALRRHWAALLDDETRAEILAIKEVVCRRAEFRRTLLSVHIYEAVLDCGVRGLDAFDEWWRARRT
jgi:hypothetical protein